MSIYSVLNIARGALSASQTSVQVTSNNIANVNTPGYAKETAVLEESRPIPTSTGTLGDGVNIKNIIRSFDKYLEKSIRGTTSDSSRQSVLSTYLDRIQEYLNEDNSQLSTNLTEYFNDWQDLATDPTSTGLKQTLVSQGQTLASSINTIYSNLKSLQDEANSQVKSDVDSVNGILTSIASLNQLILESGGKSGNSNTYMDQKTALLEELSKKIDVTTMDDEYGRTTILTTGGKPLVEAEKAWGLTTVANETTGYLNVAWQDGSGNVTDITDKIAGGELKALVEVRDTYAPDMIAGLNEIANTLTNNVKWTVTEGGVSTTTSFFTGTGAGGLAVTQSLVDDPTTISATSDPTNNPTDNDIALAMASLADQKLLAGGTSTFTDFASSLISKSGQNASDAQSASEYSSNSLTTLTSQRASVSGVSIDEEMANLIKFQYAYEAASRLFNVANELLTDLMKVVS